MSATATHTPTITGTGLVTGAPFTVTLSPLPAGSGAVFNLGNSADGQPIHIPARLQCIADATRGVTLGHPSGKALAIVEHFLAACALTNRVDVMATITSNLPADMASQLPIMEMPLLDGSAADWVPLLEQLPESQPATYTLPHAVHYQHNDTVSLYAVPSDHFQITYAVDFDHPELRNTWIHWDSQSENAMQLASAQTFGFVRELPEMQAKGLARGVTAENTLGLTDEGGYTRPLRFDHEPVIHKALDLIGDMTLMGHNPLHINAHVYAFSAGHASHTAFAKQLQPLLV